METVIELDSFTRSAKDILSEKEVFGLVDFLANNPKAGDVIPKGSGLSKLRWARSGMGKRGGARVIYYHLTQEGKVYLILAYAKSALDNLSEEQLDKLVKAME